jgi:hypothetical protein
MPLRAVGLHPVVLASDAVIPSALGFLIGHILGVGAKKQMLDVHAWRVVAAMTYMHAARDGAEGERPREPVGLPLRPGRKLWAGVDESVALTVPRASPLDTTTWLFSQARVEPFFDGHDSGSLHG